jgi:serine/threonine protein kinase
LIDEIVEPSEPASIVLTYLDTDLLKESKKKRLSRSDIKKVAKAILLALDVLHQDGLVHTDVKLDNVFVNYGSPTDERFSEIQLGDFGGVVHQDSDFAKDGHLIGAGISRSPEATLQMHWGIATDIWSFGNAVRDMFGYAYREYHEVETMTLTMKTDQVLSLLYGGDYHLFNPAIEGIKPDDDEYLLTAMKRMYKFFGPFPANYSDNPDTMTIVNYFNDSGPPEKPFHLVTTKEIPAADKKFLLNVMKLDPRERPTVADLLADEWFTEESEDTRVPLKREEAGESTT